MGVEIKDDGGGGDGDEQAGVGALGGGLEIDGGLGDAAGDDGGLPELWADGGGGLGCFGFEGGGFFFGEGGAKPWVGRGGGGDVFVVGEGGGEDALGDGDAGGGFVFLTFFGVGDGFVDAVVGVDDLEGAGGEVFILADRFWDLAFLGEGRVGTL